MATEPRVRFTREEFAPILAAVRVGGDPWCNAHSDRAEDHAEDCPMRHMINQYNMLADA